jgi:methylmalonyl-CoA/ethylmalonyl-CoA epimerase
MSKMSRIADFGAVTQIAYVSLDLGADIEYWTKEMGVGPFLRLDHIQFTRTIYQGQDCLLDVSAAFGYWGDIQVELIEQHNATPSVFKSWSDSGALGIHHVCVLVTDLSVVRARCLESGGDIVQEAWLTGVGSVIYVNFAAGHSGLIEFAELASSTIDLFSNLRRATKEWDGSNPVIHIPPTSSWGHR